MNANKALWEKGDFTRIAATMRESGKPCSTSSASLGHAGDGSRSWRWRYGDSRGEAHSFDLVVSIFGAMFAPKPFDVAREMARVTHPGGRPFESQNRSKQPTRSSVPATFFRVTANV
jgi:hypothetical protein